MVLPTPNELVERLKVVHDVTSDEALARKLDVPVRTVARWKSGRGPSFAKAISLLDQAGWLNTGGEAPSIVEEGPTPVDLLERTIRTLKMVVGNQELALDALGVPEDARVRETVELQVPGTPLPKRKGA